MQSISVTVMTTSRSPTREYPTVNGATARGGSLDVAGPVIAGGMLYVTSGYALWGGMPGNVLLAFAVRGGGGGK